MNRLLQAIDQFDAGQVALAFAAELAHSHQQSSPTVRGSVTEPEQAVREPASGAI